MNASINPGDTSTGEADRDFTRRMLIARLQWNLERAALGIVAQLAGEGLSISVPNIEASLILRVADVRPRSTIVPWHLPDTVVLVMIRRLAEKLAERSA